MLLDRISVGTSGLTVAAVVTTPLLLLLILTFAADATLIGEGSTLSPVLRAPVQNVDGNSCDNGTSASLKPKQLRTPSLITVVGPTDKHAAMSFGRDPTVSAGSYLGSDLLDNAGWLRDYQPWLCSVLAAMTIGLSGVLPLVIIPVGARSSFTKEGNSKSLRLLLSFAVGGLLGDVFLHLLPEAWHHMQSVGTTSHVDHLVCGLWVLAGIFTFIVIEMMFDKEEKGSSNDEPPSTTDHSKQIRQLNGNGVHSPAQKRGQSRRTLDGDHNGNVTNGRTYGAGKTSSNGHSSQKHTSSNGVKAVAPSESRHITGYLNLLANSIDNFAHGLAVAGSFLVSFKVGMLTTFAILIHEIPHEIGDFAILLKAGFNRYDAAKAQIATAAVGIAGAIAALSAESTQTLGNRTAWILPFTAGGFLNIALVNVLPEIIVEKDPKESFKQLLCLLAGVGVMAGVTLLFG